DLVGEIHKEFGHIDILVNNAGVAKDGLLMRMSEDQWDEVLNTNLKSAFNYTRACTSIMARQRSGSVINLSSVVAFPLSAVRLKNFAGILIV
ncbi:MAG: SDR family NAD(P)-dependent oxidoreductase, partial [Clostridia bacterium]|nr:SDR family NAD(P)-dependent oxidoreductase [Clostridia bacterium]